MAKEQMWNIFNGAGEFLHQVDEDGTEYWRRDDPMKHWKGTLEEAWALIGDRKGMTPRPDRDPV